MKKSARFPYALLMAGILITLLAATFSPVGTALAQTGTAAVLGIPAPLSPNKASNETKPTYTWTHVAGTTAYQLQVLKEYSSTVVYSYTVPTAGYCYSGKCSFNPGVKLAPFGYRWHVRVSGSTNTWSPLMTFYVRGKSFGNYFTGYMYWWTRKSGGDWYVTSNGSGSLIGYLASKGLPDKCSAAVHFTSSTYDNFVAETRLRIKGLPSGGKYPEAYLALRMKNAVDSASQCWYGGYLFGYSLDGKYSFWKMQNNGTWVALVPPTYSSAIKIYDWNNLKVVANRNRFDLYVNKAYLGYVTDSSYPIGYIGFEMRNHGSADTLFLANYITVDVIP